MTSAVTGSQCEALSDSNAGSNVACGSSDCADEPIVSLFGARLAVQLLCDPPPLDQSLSEQLTGRVGLKITI